MWHLGTWFSHGLASADLMVGLKWSWRSFSTKMILWFCVWSGVPPQKKERCLELNLFEIVSQIRQELLFLTGCRALSADWRQMGENGHFSLSYPAPLVLFWGELKASSWAGLAQGQHPPASLPWRGPERTQPRQAGILEGLTNQWGLNCTAQGGCSPGAVPCHGCLFPPAQQRQIPLAALPGSLSCVHSSCPRSHCFGLFISCSRLCCLLPPQANRFAKLPRYTNFVWQLTSLADEFCHHPSPELISLPVLQS